MRMMRVSLVLLLVAAACVGARAQEAPATVEPVLKHIPAGAMGYIVVNDVRATTANIDRFIQTIGLGPMAQRSMPAGFLQFMQQKAQVGEGFNPRGGLAVALLDFQQFGIDVMEMIPGLGAGGPPPKPPVVICVPGSSVEGLFGQFEMAPSGDYTSITFPGAAMLAVQAGDYVLLSLRADALDAVTAGGRTAETGLNDREKEMVSRADIAAHVNMRVAGPVFDKLLRMVEQQMAVGGPGGGPMPQGMQKMMGWYRQMIAQVDSAVLGGRFVSEGLVLEELVEYVPGSAMGQAIAGYRRGEGGLLDRLPDMPYVLAVGSRNMNAPAEENEMLSAYLEMMSQSLPGGALSEDDQAEMKRIAMGINEQVTAMQMVVGGAPEAGGVFSCGVVMTCKSAAATRLLVRDAFGFTEKFAKAVAPQGKLDNLRVNFSAAAESVGGASVDVIEITDPGVEQMPKDEKQQMATVLGESKIQIRMAGVDEKTLVMTFGGAEAFLGEALKLAAGGGPIPSQPGTQAAMKHLPSDPSMVLLFNLKNFGTVFQQGARKLGMSQMLPPLNFTADTPLAVGMAPVGASSAHAVLFVPTEAVQNIVQTVMMFSMGAGGPGPGSGPMEGVEDF